MFVDLNVHYQHSTLFDQMKKCNPPEIYRLCMSHLVNFVDPNIMQNITKGNVVGCSTLGVINKNVSTNVRLKTYIHENS